MGKEWEESLFSCFANIPICLIVSILPAGTCIVQAAAVNKATHDGMAVPCILIYCLLQIGGAINRETIRKTLDLDGSLATNIAIWCCCPSCAACQEYREVSSHSGRVLSS